MATVSATSQMKERSAEAATMHLLTRVPSWHVCTCASLGCFFFCLFSASPIASQTLWHQNVCRTKTVFASAGGMLAPKAPTMASCGVPCYLWSSHCHGHQHSLEPPLLPLLGPGVPPCPPPRRAGAAGDTHPGHWGDPVQTTDVPPQAMDVPAILCPRWTRGQVSKVRHGAQAHSKRRQRGKKSCFHNAWLQLAVTQVRTRGEHVLGAACWQHSRFTPASHTDNMWWQLACCHQQMASDHHGYNVLSFPKAGQDEDPDTGGEVFMDVIGAWCILLSEGHR